MFTGICVKCTVYVGNSVKHQEYTKKCCERKNKMNKSDLIVEMTEKTGLSRREVEKIVSEIMASMIEKLAQGEKVSLSGFGTFETRTRAAHTGRDPRTGAMIEIRETSTVAFRPGKVLKSAITK